MYRFWLHGDFSMGWVNVQIVACLGECQVVGYKLTIHNEHHLLNPAEMDRGIPQET